MGFLHKGRNLFFLPETKTPSEVEITVPIYETAIRLADTRPYYPSDTSPAVRALELYMKRKSRWNLPLHSSTRRSNNFGTGAGRCSRKVRDPLVEDEEQKRPTEGTSQM